MLCVMRDWQRLSTHYGVRNLQYIHPTVLSLRSGPWRGLWIRRRYDPRRAKAGEERRLARSYQVIEVRVPPTRCVSPQHATLVS